jgi:hypothetical protein
MRKLVVLAALAGCGGDSTRVDKPPGSGAPSVVESPAVPDAAAVVVAPVDAAPPPDAPPPPAGADLLASVELLYDVVACGGDGKLPDAMTDKDGKLAAIVKEHCASLRPYIDKFRTAYFDKARAWFVEHEPKDLPTVVVYPFGGGDLLSALVAFPDATEITTISLELSGDPRKLAGLTPAQLKDNLLGFRHEVGSLINNDLSSSMNMSDQQRNALAAQLSSHLLGLVTGGYELVGARYFVLDDRGEIHYLTQVELDADTRSGTSLRGNWKAPAFAQSFANVELQFRKRGESTVRVFRHIAWNLDNAHLKTNPQLILHLAAKGKVAVLEKGGHYLLWIEDFATIRNYLLDHLVWMVSDSTGIPPNLAPNMVQEAYGRFDAPLLDTVKGIRSDAAMRQLWKTPAGTVTFRYGYTDKSGHAGVLITKPK